MPGTGRIPSPDPQDQQFPMRLVQRLLGVDDRAPVTRLHRTGPILDQGETGTCVLNAWEAIHLGNPKPRAPDPGLTPFDQYRRVVAMDEFPGNDAEATAPDAGLQYGTSVRAGARFYAQIGRIDGAYVWGRGADDSARHVSFVAPCVLGTEWKDSFWNPDREGIVRITPRSRSVGGHAYKWVGVDVERGLAVLQNSWGLGWGGWFVRGRLAHRGLFRMPLEDVDRLIREDGECCAAVENALRRTA